MSDFTFLTAEQCFGGMLGIGKSYIFEKRERKAAITDFSVLLGGLVTNGHVKYDSHLTGRVGWYWTRQWFSRCMRDGG